MSTTSQPALDATSPLLQQLRELLRSSGYCDAGIAPTINDSELAPPGPGAPPTQLNTLLRLFIMLAGCRPEHASAATLPLTLAQLLEAGILRANPDGVVSSVLGIQPYHDLLFAFERANPDVLPEEAVMFVSPSSVEVAHFMTRRPARRALDVGTGSGFLASLLAPFSEHVHAIDVNPAALRAAEFNACWNGLANITFLSGNLFEPVRDLRFDLIVSNPPFIIAPVTAAFSSRYRFKHSGEEGDTFCIRLAREASQLLNEDGYFHMMFQWEETGGQPWSSKLEPSFSGLGCDAWVARILSVPAEEHVSEWITSLTEEEQSAAETLAEQARQYFQKKNVCSIGTGLLPLRRASHRQNYFWFDEAPEDRSEPYGESVSALIDIRTHVLRVGDSGLLQEKLRVSPHLSMLQSSDIQKGRWKPTTTELLLDHGLKYSFGDLVPQLSALIATLDGSRTVKEALDLAAQENPTAAPEAVAACLLQIRELLWYGFLIPMHFDSK